jgi:hypothetical protein
VHLPNYGITTSLGRVSRELERYSIHCSAIILKVYEQSATAPVIGTSNYCLCRMTSPVQRISVLRLRRHRQSLFGPDLAIFIDNQQSIQDPEAVILCWH